MNAGGPECVRLQHLVHHEVVVVEFEARTGRQLAPDGVLAGSGSAVDENQDHEARMKEEGRGMKA